MALFQRKKTDNESSDPGVQEVAPLSVMEQVNEATRLGGPAVNADDAGDSGVAGIKPSLFGLGSRLSIKLGLLVCLVNGALLYWLGKNPVDIAGPEQFHRWVFWLCVLNAVLVVFSA